MTTPSREKSFESDEKLKLPRPFIMRRMHSILGLWLVLYLCEHLLVNSRAAFFFRDNGYGFVTMVNSINNLPYLRAIEIIFLAIPFAIHGIWGFKYALTAKPNSVKTDGSEPALFQYKRNASYSWQRITSWAIAIGIAAHVIQMRFLDYPTQITHRDRHVYLMPVKYDAALPLVAEKLYTHLYSIQEIEKRKEELKGLKEKLALAGPAESFSPSDPYYHLKNEIEYEEEWIKGAEKKPLKQGRVLAASPSIGAAFFLIVRETFQNPVMVILYSALVVATCYHAFNGLWTFMITWGITLTRRSQKTMRKIATLLMWLVSLLGLMAVWGIYWTTLLQK